MDIMQVEEQKILNMDFESNEFCEEECKSMDTW